MVETHDGNEPKKQLETARGGSGRKGRTAIGAGDSGEGDDHFLWPSEQYEPRSGRGFRPSVIICESDSQLRAGFKCMFSNAFASVAEASTTSEAWDLIRKYEPNLVVCSGDLGVFSLSEKIRSKLHTAELFEQDCIRTYVLVLTDTFCGTRYFHRLIGSGAISIARKCASEEELIRAGQCTINCKPYFDQGIENLVRQPPKMKFDGKILVGLEIEIWVRLNLDNDEIRRELNVSENQFKAAYERLLLILGVATRKDAINEATRRGLVSLPKLDKVDPATSQTLEAKQARLNCKQAIERSMTPID
jgi:Response regulator containing a CheY-like receiver domain and an HTH DNA-binding domain